MIDEFIKKLNEAESNPYAPLNPTETSAPAVDGDAPKAPKAPKKAKEEGEAEESEESSEEADPVVEILKKALVKGGYNADEDNVAELVSALEAVGMTIELGEDSEEDEIVGTLVNFLKSNDENAENTEDEPENEHEEGESKEEEAEEHKESTNESCKTSKKMIKENDMPNFGIAQVDKLSRSLGALEGLLDSIKDEKTKTKFNKIYGDLNSIIADLSNAETAEVDAIEDIANEEPVEPVVEEPPMVDEPSDEMPTDEEVPVPEETPEEEPEVVATESVKPAKKTSMISESANKYLETLDWTSND